MSLKTRAQTQEKEDLTSAFFHRYIIHIYNYVQASIGRYSLATIHKDYINISKIKYQKLNMLHDFLTKIGI